MQPLAIGFTKLAFLFLYRRIFTWPGFQWTSLVFIVLTVAFTIAFFFGFIFDCRLNFAANWGSLASIAENCPFGFEATITFTVLDAVFDLCILLLPLPWVSLHDLDTDRQATNHCANRSGASKCPPSARSSCAVSSYSEVSPLPPPLFAWSSASSRTHRPPPSTNSTSWACPPTTSSA